VRTKSILSRRWPTVLGLLAIMASPVFGQVDRVHGGAVSAADFSSRYALVSATPDNLHWVQDPAGSSRSVMQLRVRDTDQKVYGALRTEVALSRDYIREGVRWYALSMYFPADWTPHPYPVVVGQLHTSQKSAVFSPPVAFVVHGQNMDLELYANHRSIEGADPATRANSARQTIRLDRLKLGQWYCFVLRADWSPHPGQGALKIWMNGDKVYEAADLYNSYETWLGNYPRAGIYMPGMPSVSERMLYLDFIHVGGQRSSYDEMAAQTPCQAIGGKGAKK
jgi:hypothetical protein